MNKEKIRGIYKITNIINNKVYIGESLDMYRRWDEHKEDLNNNNHHSYKLQKDWNEFGEDSFKFEIIATLDDAIKSYIDKFILIIFENKFIKEFNSLENGYNVEYTLTQVLNGEKILFNKKDMSALEGWIYRFEIGKVIEKDKIIYVPKYFNINDLKKKLRVSKSELISLFTDNKIIYEHKVGKYLYNYELSNEFKNNNDIMLQSNRVDDILLTKSGLDYLYSKLKLV